MSAFGGVSKLLLDPQVIVFFPEEILESAEDNYFKSMHFLLKYDREFDDELRFGFLLIQVLLEIW